MLFTNICNQCEHPFHTDKPMLILCDACFDDYLDECLDDDVEYDDGEFDEE